MWVVSVVQEEYKNLTDRSGADTAAIRHGWSTGASWGEKENKGS